MVQRVRKSASSPVLYSDRLRALTRLAVGAALALSMAQLYAQVVPGKNVNMVAGTTWPDGDPFLQRQNEGVIATSTRNILHLLAGGNDYRTVDLPGLPTTKPSGDAWPGLFKSLDGGESWKSNLLPGYPQDTSAAGLASPLRGYDAGADPVVRAGSNGLFYYSGIVFQRAAPIADVSIRDEDEKVRDNEEKVLARKDRVEDAKVETSMLQRFLRWLRGDKRAAATRSSAMSRPENEAEEQEGTAPTASAVFVSTFIDLNNQETGDPIRYVRTTLVDRDPGARFLDKQWMAVDVPRAGAQTCTLEVPQENGPPVLQTFPGGRVYVAYTAFTGPERGTIFLSTSTDCGNTWNYPRDISSNPDPDVNDDGIVNTADLNLISAAFGRRCGEVGYNRLADTNKDCLVNVLDLTSVSKNIGRTYSTLKRIPQGATLAIQPTTGDVYVAWREFRNGSLPDAIQFSRSTNFGNTFSLPATIATFSPFDQGSTAASFRTTAYPTIAADTSRVYVAWSARGYALGRGSATTGDARIVLSSSTNGTTWTPPYPVDEPNRFGHQIMPSLAFGAGKLALVYYDLREDVSRVFGPFVDETQIFSQPPPQLRHTVDVRLAQANPGPQPLFSSVQLSDYAFGVVPGSQVSEQLTFNPPNLPMFKRGLVPFMGDYIDISMSPPMVPNADGTWAFNTQASNTLSGYAVWTDNRNVKPGPGGDLVNYTPPDFATRPTQSRVDPTQSLPICTPGSTGTRNQDLFSARFDAGLFATVVGNAKPLGNVQRAFALMVQNTTGLTRSFRLTIVGQPPGGSASFRQFGASLTTLDVSIPRISAVARSVYATSSDPVARILIDVSEIAAPGAALVPGGLQSTLTINPDPSNPAIENPAIENPAIENRNIQSVEVYNPRVNPAIENPAIENPAIENPAIENPAIENVTVANRSIVQPAIENPAIENPAIENPAIENPAIENISLANAAISDTTWALTNDGNTTAVYGVKLLLNQAVPNGIVTQLIVHKQYTTPAAADCELLVQLHTNVLVNITNPTFALQNPGTPAIENPAIENPAIENPAIENATVAVPPGETYYVTVRVVDPIKDDPVTFNPAAAITPAAVAQSVNTEDVAPVGQPQPPPPAAVSTTIAVPDLDDALGTGGTFDQQLYASVPGTWSISGGGLPPGVALSPDGNFSGTPGAAGDYTFTVQFTDTGNPPHVVTRTYTVHVAQPLAVTTATVPEGVAGLTYQGAIQTSGGVEPRYFTVSAGALPVGVLLDRLTGALTGAPAAAGTFTFTVHVVDGATPSAAVDVPLVLTVTEPVAAFTKTWAGTDNNWFNAANWAPAGVPTAADDVLIAGSAFQPFLSANASVHSLQLTGGATVNLNGFALTAFGNVRAGDTIVNGTLVMTGEGVTLSGTVPNLVIAQGASVTSAGAVHAQGDLTHEGSLALAGYALVVDGSLIVPAGLVGPPPIVGAGALVTVGGLDVASLILDNARVQMTGGVFYRFDNVTFENFPPAAIRLSLFNPGSLQPWTFFNTTFVGEPTTGAYIAATDTLNDLNVFTIHLVNSDAVNGPAHTAQIGGAIVNWATELADLEITSHADAPDPATVGGQITYTLAVTNHGPADAVDVRLATTLPDTAFVSALSGQGSCLNTGASIDCSLGTIPALGTVPVTIVVQATTETILSHNALVFSVATAESDLTNNHSLETTTVAPAVATADLSVTTVRAPAQPTVGAPLTYTLTVTNNGPGDASSVTLVDVLPPGVTFVSVSNDICQQVAGVVTCAFGNINALASEQISITVTPNTAAFITNTATVSAAQSDPVPANNQSVDAVLVQAFATCSAPTFYAGAPYSFGTATSSNPFVAGDFNEDTHLDTATVVQRSMTNRVVALMLGDGIGGFTQGTDFVITGTPQRIVVGEFTGDTHLDLAVTLQNVPSIGGAVQILRGTGAGTFTADAAIPIAGQPIYLETGDLNHDNHLDLVVGNFATGTSASVLLGNGAGAFAVSSLGEAVEDGMQIVDYDGDTHPDVVVLQQSLHGVRVMTGDGLGGFAAGATLTVPDFLSALRNLGDVNGDGYPDLAIGTAALQSATLAGVSLVLNDGVGGLQPPVQILAPFSQRSSRVINVGELNGDGYPDLVLVSQPTGTLVTMLGNGAGGFGPPVSYVVDNPSRVVAADVNQDGRTDLLATAQQTGLLYVLLNTCNVGNSADLVVTMTGPANATAGDTLTYHATVTNNGPSPATNLVAKSVLPAGMRFTGAVTGCPNFTGDSCNIPLLPVNGSVTVDIGVEAFSAGTLSPRTMVTAPQHDPNPSNNVGVATTVVATAPVTFVVTNTNATGSGSLRQAILDSNLNAGSTNQIHFEIPGSRSFHH